MTNLWKPLLLLLLLARFVDAQSRDVVIQAAKPVPFIGPLTRPYQPRYISPVNLANTSRLESLLRAGNLYLTVDDVIALALENNIDIAIQRYGPRALA